MARVSIVNCYDDGNRGSEALNTAAIAAARLILPDSEVGLVSTREFGDQGAHKFRHTLSTYPDARILEPLLDKSSLRFGRFGSVPTTLMAQNRPGFLMRRTTQDFIEHSDLVISRGGVIYQTGSSGLPSFLQRTSAMRHAHLTGVPTMHLGLHVMQVKSTLGRRLVHEDFMRSKLLLPRGPISHSWVVQYAPNARILRSPDSVFGLYDMWGGAQAKFEKGHWGVSITNKAEQELNRMVSLIARCAETGMVGRVSILLQVTGDDDDTVASERLAHELSRYVDVSIIDPDAPAASLVTSYRHLEIIVSTRLHAAILGLLGGVPSAVIPVGSRMKDVDVLTEVGLGELLLEDPDTETQVEHLRTLLLPSVREFVGDAVRRAALRHSESVARAATLVG